MDNKSNQEAELSYTGYTSYRGIINYKANIPALDMLIKIVIKYQLTLCQR